jgi:chaperonin GroES
VAGELNGIAAKAAFFRLFLRLPDQVAPRSNKTTSRVNWRGASAQRKIQKNMELNLRPLGDRIVVEAIIEQDKSPKKGGIIIPDTAKEKPMESRVVAVGTGKTDDNGKKVPFEVKKGDRVLVTRYGGTEIKLDGKEYKILNSEDVLAIME